MLRLPTLTSRQYLLVAHDLVVTALAILASFFIRFEEGGLAERLDWLLRLLPGFVIYAACIYLIFGLHTSKWRFTSLPDLSKIARASAVLALSLLVLDYILVSPQVYGAFFFGKITIALYWFVQMAFLAGSRIAYRQFRYVRTQQHVRGEHSVLTLVLGRAADADVLLRAIESGAVSRVRPVGILSPSMADRGQSVRGIPVVGSLDDLEQVVRDSEARGTHILRLIFTPSALIAEAAPESTLMRARRLGLQTSRLPVLSEGGEAVQLAPIAVEDLLLRDTVSIDYHRLEEVVRGKSIIVTGGGGSIGAEICDRVVTFGASRLLVVEHSEVALYTVLETLRAKGTAAEVDGRIADVRERERIMRVFADFKPEIVFHAAALKHVPLLERDWGEGIKTNVFGSVNVIDAAVAAGASAMVMISTDKAIEPVSVLGATKRLAEMYAQALDADFARRAAGRPAMRLIAVRFGNALASNRSVVPKFKAQIEAGGPVTVTHPDMVRYFMTIREACDLVVTAASHALETERPDVSVYVLNMGQQVKIVELAERMMALSGLATGRVIKNEHTGIRPGQRLHEILFGHNEPIAEIGIAGIVAAKPSNPSVEAMRRWLATLEQGLARNDRSVIYGVLRDAVPDFRGEAA